MAGLLSPRVTSNPAREHALVPRAATAAWRAWSRLPSPAHGSVANVNSIKSDQVESGFAQSDVTYWAYTGTGPFEGKEPIKKLCVLASLYPEHVHVIAGKGRNIGSVGDLKGKSVAMGLPGSHLVGARLVVEAYGLDEKKDFKAEYVKSKTGADMIRDNHLDAFITVSGYPNAAIVEMASTQGAEVVKVTGSERDALIQKAPFYQRQ